MRGTTSVSTGSMPIVRIAAISSRIFIEPISAVKADADRPATMTAVSSTPDFAQCQHRQHARRIGLGAVGRKLQRTLLHDDSADQEADQRDDRCSPEPRMLQMVGEGSPAEPRLPRQCAGECSQEDTEKTRDINYLAACRSGPRYTLT